MMCVFICVYEGFFCNDTHQNTLTRQLQEAYRQIERNMEIVGCTGIEDQLQEDVHLTISALRRAGMQVMMIFCWCCHYLASFQ